MNSHNVFPAVYPNSPRGKDTRRFRLIQSRRLTPLIKAHNQCTDPKRPHASTLGVPLLHTSNMLGDVLDRDGVLNGQTVRLGLSTSLVDEDARISV